ncbi:MAG TPA: type IV pilus modification protein PilV [Burkholderiaceae bacterium]|nr:type IV pilus modification protein PilV [Burkholderiaceae bacterium]
MNIKSLPMPMNQRGASLIEVLISLMLVAVTMLGLLGVQLRSMNLQKDSLDRRNAAILVAGFADRVAANFPGFDTGVYDNRTMGVTDAPPATAAACTAPCTSAEVGQRDWDLLRQTVRARLPGGIAGIRTSANNASLLVTVGWLDPQRTQEMAQLKGTQADLNSDNVDDACAALGVTDQNYRCYVTNVMP